MKKHMRLLFTVLTGAILFIQNGLYAQSPYSIAPKWYFGFRGGISFPTSGSPTPMAGGLTGQVSSGQEATSTMCDTLGNVIFYTDSYRLYDGAHNLVQTIRGGTSSTNSSVCFPDPADPFNYFYLVTLKITQPIRISSLGLMRINGFRNYKFLA